MSGSAERAEDGAVIREFVSGAITVDPPARVVAATCAQFLDDVDLGGHAHILPLGPNRRGYPVTTGVACPAFWGIRRPNSATAVVPPPEVGNVAWPCSDGQGPMEVEGSIQVEIPLEIRRRS